MNLQTSLVVSTVSLVCLASFTAFLAFHQITPLLNFVLVVYVISTSTNVSCLHIFIPLFQTLSNGCLMIIDPICRKEDTSITPFTSYRTGIGVCCVRAAIIFLGVASSDQLVNGTRAFLASSSSHAVPQISSD